MAQAKAKDDYKAFKLQQDQELRRIVFEAWDKHPGMVSNHAEGFLKDLRVNPDYYRLSPGQKRYLLQIAIDQLLLEIPAEIYA